MQPWGAKSHIRERLSEQLRHLFPDRQIHLRSEGRVTYINLSRRTQIACVLALAGVVGWGTFTTVNFSLHDQVLAAKDMQLAGVRLAYQSLLNEVSGYQKRFGAVAKDLEENHGLMMSLLEQNTMLQRNLRSAEGELQSTRAEQQQVMTSSEDLKNKLHELRQNVQNLTTNNFQLRDNLDQTQSGLAVALQARNQAVSESRRLAQQATELENRLKSLETNQQSAISRLSEQTVSSIEGLERVVNQTGLKVSQLLDEGKGKFSGQGGPFIEVKPDGLPADHLKANLASLESNLDRWESLQTVLRRIPLAPPLANFQVNSGFGKRHDPINNRWSMHYGLDLGSPMKSPVMVTAPGTVASVGWDSRYGNLIEVDHGSGLITRYGHLASTLVKKGQQVDFHQTIGLVGSTGRSTGAHLHYEIVFKGRPMNPMDFLQAGRNVFKD
jgi:murein DD-endopeptidase MepM/ murein hydrolase activator NlpD